MLDPWFYSGHGWSMSEITGGIRSILSRPLVYGLWSRVVGGKRGRRTLIGKDARPAVEQVLDLGCGPGELLEFLPTGVGYVGIDTSAEYIAKAADAIRRARGARSRRHDAARTGGDASSRRHDAARPGGDASDLVLAFGVIHNPNDQQARGLFSDAAGALASGGQFTVDPAYAREQSRAAQRSAPDSVRALHSRVRSALGKPTP